MAPFVFVPVEYSTEGAIHSKFNGLQHNLVEATVLRGVGHISGKKVTFRLSRADYDYE